MFTSEFCVVSVNRQMVSGVEFTETLCDLQYLTLTEMVFITLVNKRY